MDQFRSLPDLVWPSLWDPLSSAIRTLSQGLQALQFRVCAECNLFWPYVEEVDVTIPSWPRLRTLYVEFQPFLPSGAWYFNGPRGEGPKTRGFFVDESAYPPARDRRSDRHWDRLWNQREDRTFKALRYGEIAPDMFRVIP